MKFLRKLLIALVVLLVLGLGLFLGRTPILHAVGNQLVSVDTPIQVDAAFVLSGNSWERAQAAVALDKLGLCPIFVCTGEGVNQTMQSLGLDLTDAVQTQRALLEQGMDSSRIALLPQGTSTWEESEHILGYCRSMDYRRVAIISSLHHTRRIASVFKEKYRKEGIEVLVLGARPQDYDPERWWQYEGGLIMVNNEYLKLIYYAFKH